MKLKHSLAMRGRGGAASARAQKARRSAEPPAPCADLPCLVCSGADRITCCCLSRVFRPLCRTSPAGHAHRRQPVCHLCPRVHRARSQSLVPRE